MMASHKKSREIAMSRAQNLIKLCLTFSLLLTFSCQKGEQEKSEVQELASKMKSTQDSLKELGIKAQKDKIGFTDRLKQLEIEKAALESAREKEDIQKLIRQKQQVREKLEASTKALYDFKSEHLNLQNKKETIKDRLEYMDKLAQRSKKDMRSDMMNVDSIVKNLEDEQLIEQKKISIMQKEISISKSKTQANRDEQDLLEELRINRIRENAPDSEIDLINRKMATVNTAIQDEQKKMADIQTQISNSENRIAEIDKQLQNLTQLIKNKYDKNEILREYGRTETARLKKDLERALADDSRLTERIIILETENDSLANRITVLNDAIQSLSGSNAEDIGGLESRPEPMKTEVTEPESEKGSEDKSGSSVDQLSRISDKTAKKHSDNIQSQVAEQKQPQKELEGTADLQDQNGSENGNWGYTIFLLIVVIVLILGFLFFIGKYFSAKKRK